MIDTSWRTLVESGALVGAVIGFFEKPENDHKEHVISHTHVRNGFVEVEVGEVRLMRREAKEHTPTLMINRVHHQIPIDTPIYRWELGEEHYYFSYRDEAHKTDSFTIHLRKSPVL